MNERLPGDQLQLPPRFRALTRRDLLRTTGVGLTGAGAALLLGCGDDGKAKSSADGRPEVTKIRMPLTGASCFVPMWVARDFFVEEGLEPEFVPQLSNASIVNEKLSSGALDISLNFAPPLAYAIDVGEPVVVLSGAHPTCFELFARDGIESIADLRGKRIAITERNAKPADYVFLQSILQYIGISPTHDVALVHVPASESYRAWARGDFDAVVVGPPEAQSYHATKSFGHVIVNSMTDPPWTQYFCCQIATNREFLRRNPNATKRALRAMLRGIDLCASDPDRAARLLIDLGHTSSYDDALESVKGIPYGVWRQYDPEDSLRFYSLQLHEAGIVKGTPDEIIKRGTDWRFLNELKQEMAYFPPQDEGRSAFALDCAIEGPKEG